MVVVYATVMPVLRRVESGSAQQRSVAAHSNGDAYWLIQQVENIQKNDDMYSESDVFGIQGVVENFHS